MICLATAGAAEGFAEWALNRLRFASPREFGPAISDKGGCSCEGDFATGIGALGRAVKPRMRARSGGAVRGVRNREGSVWLIFTKYDQSDSETSTQSAARQRSSTNSRHLRSDLHSRALSQCGLVD